MRFTSTIFLIVSITLASTTVHAGDACPPLPQVSWWSNLSHTKVIKFVDEKMGGDWKTYTEKWKSQLSLLTDVHARHSEVVIKSRNLRLKGDALAKYIDKVRKRIAVTRCLAKKSSHKMQAADKDKGQTLSEQSGCAKNLVTLPYNCGAFRTAWDLLLKAMSLRHFAIMKSCRT
jgi:hypothetical protein